MKRIRLFVIMGLLLLGIGVLWVGMLFVPSTTSLPIYPRTFGEIRTLKGELLNAKYDTRLFKTTDSGQLVQDYYDDWFAAHGWTFRLENSGPGRPGVIRFYYKFNQAELSHIDIKDHPRSVLPLVRVHYRLYEAQVMTTPDSRTNGQFTDVSLGLTTRTLWFE